MNLLSILLVAVIGIAFCVALYVLVTKKTSRCANRNGCEGCALKDTCGKT